MARKATPTRQEYGAFQQAFDFFNRELFGGKLHACFITLQRKANARGYFSSKMFEGRVRDGEIDEIALNPNTFKDRSDREICSTLVHEMVHEWQQWYGKPSRGRYHNAEWADKMEALGLMPTSTGDADGKRTGQRVTHYIIRSGSYDTTYAKLQKRGFALNWQAHVCSKNGRTPPSKVKFTCPHCGQNVWGKPDTRVYCAVCLPPDLQDVDKPRNFLMLPDDKDEHA
jgi:predicted SprT family Zn-dependent metalloprotease